MATQAKTEQKSEIRPAQSRMARGALGWGIRELGKAAGVSHDTIVRFERGDELKDRTIEAIRAAFESAGIVFIPENGGGPGVRLKRRGKH
jgi:DNA-binding XRE family transcriptional regulator